MAIRPEGNWQLEIPLSNGSSTPIQQIAPTVPQKMLGVWSFPTGDNNKHVQDNIIARYKKWVNRSKNGHLPSKLNWMSYRSTLWPGIQYGLATLSSLPNSTAGKICRLDYDALPLLGVNCSVKRE
jgi:hypothetical protein